jgi:RNase P/RNase MRP subunit p29
MEKDSPQYNGMTVAQARDVIGQESRIVKSVGRGETGSHGKILVMTNASCLDFVGGV